MGFFAIFFIILLLIIFKRKLPFAFWLLATIFSVALILAFGVQFL
ncbi:hypothetical protein CSG_5950 [Campylobacter fetus subsp. venerealis str. 84-112]|nr:Hypothetical protein CFV354_0578 [Campylobacter fetus subsp. venerealis NCTC 10354]CDF64515.1 hypothetical protein CSG_5950 [Campylobacter fetus subsp. venerealis str. 84-112]